MSPLSFLLLIALAPQVRCKLTPKDVHSIENTQERMNMWERLAEQERKKTCGTLKDEETKTLLCGPPSTREDDWTIESILIRYRDLHKQFHQDYLYKASQEESRRETHHDRQEF